MFGIGNCGSPTVETSRRFLHGGESTNAKMVHSGRSYVKVVLYRKEACKSLSEEGCLIRLDLQRFPFRPHLLQLHLLHLRLLPSQGRNLGSLDGAFTESAPVHGAVHALTTSALGGVGIGPAPLAQVRRDGSRVRAWHNGVRVNGCARGRRVDVVRHEVAFAASVGRGGGGGSRLSSGRRLRFVRDGSVGGDCGRRGHGGA